MFSARLFCAVLMAFPYSFCSQPLLYEMGVEFMCSLPGSFVAGYMTVLNNLFVDVIYVVLYFFPRFGNTITNQFYQTFAERYTYTG